LQDVIEGQIYPPLSAGFTDENAYIRELTLKSILVLAPKMRQATLTQNLLKHLSRLQVRCGGGAAAAAAAIIARWQIGSLLLKSDELRMSCMQLSSGSVLKELCLKVCLG
jgi:SCY1-like protein 1